MHKKVAVKLSAYFAIALILLSLVMSFIFVALLKNHTVTVYKADLEKRAVNIANTLSSFNTPVSEGGIRKGGQGSGYGAYVRFIGDIAGTNVWVIDQQHNLITSGNGNGIQRKYNLSELPENASKLIDEVFNNQTVFSEEFSNVLEDMSLTVGTPIVDQNQQVIGAVLLHSPIASIDEALKQGIYMLIISVLVAIVIAFMMAVFLSLRFTRPLKVMNKQAQCMASGDFLVANHIQMQDEIGELASTLNELASKLEDADNLSKHTEQLRRDFIANISHELKTPITVIRGSLEALCDKVVTDSTAVERYYDQMLFETKYLQRLIGDLLELSKLQNADFVIEKEALVLHDVINNAVQSIQPLAASKSIQIQFECIQTEDMFLGDYGRLRQMVMVLLDNAVKFSAEGTCVKVGLDNGILAISDQGIGISESDLPHLFEKFYKARNENNKSGTGLGLAIASQIAVRHGIKVHVSSILGRGTTFKLDFNPAKMSQ